MKKIIQLVMLVAFSSSLYAVKPYIPLWNWHVTAKTEVQDTFNTIVDVWSGFAITTYNVYANEIKIVEDFSTGEVHGALTGAQVVNDTHDISSLLPGSYTFYFEGCNDDGCSRSSGHTMTVIASGVEGIVATGRTPTAPTIRWMNARQTSDFIIEWDMWWGTKGDTVELYINDTLIASETRSDYSEEDGGQNGLFNVSMTDMDSKSLSGPVEAIVKLCINTNCASSSALNLELLANDQSNVPDEVAEEESEKEVTPIEKEEIPAPASLGALDPAEQEVPEEQDNPSDSEDNDEDNASAQEGEEDNNGSVLDEKNIAPTRVNILAAAKITSTTADVSWDASQDLDGQILHYYVAYKVDEEGDEEYGEEMELPPTIALIKLTGLLADTHYLVLVRAKDDKNTYSEPSEVAFTTLSTDTIEDSNDDTYDGPTHTPNAPAMGWISDQVSEPFTFNLEKWWGDHGTSWKLKHFNKATGIETIYDIGEAVVNESNAQERQTSALINIIPVFVDKYSSKEDSNDTDSDIKLNSRSTDITIEIESAKGKMTTHGFTAMLCNGTNCSKSELRYSEFVEEIVYAPVVPVGITAAANPQTACGQEEDMSGQALEGDKIDANRCDLKISRDTWSGKEPQWGETYAQTDNQIYRGSTPYTEPTPKSCPNIDSQGLINGKEVMAYYAGWAVYSNGRRHYPRDLDGCNLTGVLFAFAYPGPDGGLYIGDGWGYATMKIGSNTNLPESSRYTDDHSLGFYGVFNQLAQFKKEYPHVKVYLSIGGWTWKTYMFKTFDDAEARTRFVETTVEFLRTYKLFDGIDIDWEFPATAKDRTNFNIVLDELRVALDDAVTNPKPGYEFKNQTDTSAYVPRGGKFTLSVAIAPGAVKLAEFMDLEHINSVVDFVIYMAYDYAGTWNNYTAHQSPLFDSTLNGETGPYLTVGDSTEIYLLGEKNVNNPSGFNETGLSARKLILGLPYYGRGWITDKGDTPYQYLGAKRPAEGTWETGVIDYKALKSTILSDRDNWTLLYDPVAVATTAFGKYKGQKAIWSYDDEKVICKKMAFAREKDLGGVFAWESNGDDGSLQAEAVNGLLDEVDCDAKYPDSNYDVVFKNKEGDYKKPIVVDGDAAAALEALAHNGSQNIITGGTVSYPDESELPTDEELMKDAEQAVAELPEAEAEAVKELVDQLEFDKSVLEEFNLSKLTRATTLGANVRLVQKLIPEQVYHQLFPMQHPYYSYENLLRAIQAFPRLCGEVGQTDTQCKEEIAAIFANFVQETGANVGYIGTTGTAVSGLRFYHNPPRLAGGDLPKDYESLKKRLEYLDLEITNDDGSRYDTLRFRIPGWRQGLFAVAESTCRATLPGEAFQENACSTYRGSCAANYYGDVWRCPSNTKYYGRGAHQLTHSYNYGRFASFLWGAENRQKLVDNPNYIIDNEPWLLMLSATWFHMASAGVKPSMHAVATGIWKPGPGDIAGNRLNEFGTMINIINGGVECGKVTPQATTRGERYMKFREYLGLPEVDHDYVRCDDQSPFFGAVSDSGSGPIYYTKGDEAFTCELVSWETGFSVYDKDGSGLIECVKYHWTDQRPISIAVPQFRLGDGETPNGGQNSTPTAGAEVVWVDTFDKYDSADIFREKLGIILDVQNYVIVPALSDEEYLIIEDAILDYSYFTKLKEARKAIVKLKDVYEDHGLTISDFSEYQGSYSLLNLDVDSEKWPANVKRIKKIFPEEKWNYVFPLVDATQTPDDAKGVSKIKGLYTYKNFLNAAAFYPEFCNQAYNEDGNVTITDEEVLVKTCKRALSGMFAHFAQEVGAHNNVLSQDPALVESVADGADLSYWTEAIAEWRQGLFHVKEYGCNYSETGTDCPYRSCDPLLYECAEDETVRYMGRGAKQLSYNYNYIPFSQVIFGYDYGHILRDQPELLAEDGRLALLSAFFFYMTPQPPKPSMHAIDTGAYIPSAGDIAGKRYRGFGASVQIINAECVASGPDKAQAKNRFNYFEALMNYFGIADDIDPEKDLTCVGMKQFGGNSSGTYDSYWEEDWLVGGHCSLVSYQTKYSAFEQGTYKECVKEKRAKKLAASLE